MTHAFTYFSTFSGIGGFEAAIQTTRPQAICVGYSEINKHACQIYRSHFPTHTDFGDITKLDPNRLPDFKLLVGGFPCQAFSIAGRRRGFTDTRGALFFEVARLLGQKQPRLLLLENVKGLLSHDAGRTFIAVLAALDELGYDLQWQVLNSKNFGVAQNRERVFIVGHLRGTPRPEIFPLGAPPGRLSLEPVCERREKRISSLWSVRDPYGRRKTKLGRRRVRFLTPLECERLQGFPDGWTEGISDAQRYNCLGNAVTVPVVKAIIARMFPPSPPVPGERS